MATKEDVCNEKLRPLLMQIEQICNEHGINVAAQFILDVNPSDPNEHRTCTFFVAGAKDDDVAIKKLLNAAYSMLGPEGIQRFVEEARATGEFDGTGMELELGRVGGESTPDGTAN